MCQFKSDGGRRCPIHRHDSLAAVNFAASTSGLDKKQVEETFVQLRREGRSLGRGGADPREWASYLQNLKQSTEGTGNASNVEKAFEHSNAPDKSTMYALQRLTERSNSKKRALTQRLLQIAEEQHRTLADVQEQYKAARAEAIASKESSSYTRENVLEAQNQGIPSDTATVVAIEAVKATPRKDEGKRVHSYVPTPNIPSVSEVGYDESSGRLEVKSNDGVTMEYRNVSLSEMEEFHRTGDINPIRNNPQHQYRDAKESDGESFNVRCESCGQFKGGNHVCPLVKGDDATVDYSHEKSIEIAVEDDDNGVTYLSVSELGDLNMDAVGQAYALPNFQTYSQVEYDFSDKFENSDGDHSVVSISADRFYSLVSYFNLDEENNLGDEEDFDFKRNVIVSKKTYETMLTKYQQGDTKLLLEGDAEPFKALATHSYDVTVESISSDGKVVFGLNPVPRRYRINSYSSDIARQREGIVNETQKNLLNSGEAVKLEYQKNGKTSFVLDGEHKETTQIKTAATRDIDSSLRSGKTVIIPVAVKVDDIPARAVFSRMGIDNLGYESLEGEEPSTNMVSGTIASKLNEEGVVVCDEKATHLKCECPAYKENYDCKHVHYLSHRGGFIGQQSLKEKPVAHRLLTPELSAVPHLSVVDGDTISFEDAPHSVESTYVMAQRKIFKTEIGARPEEVEFSKDELEKIDHLAGIASNFGQVTVLNVDKEHVTRAVRHAPVKIPYSCKFKNNSKHGNFTASGTVTYQKMEEGEFELTVKSHTLKCPCPEYAEKYDCIHVRDAIAIAPAAVSIENDSDSGSITLSEYMEAHEEYYSKFRQIASARINGEDVEAALREHEALVRIRQDYADRRQKDDIKRVDMAYKQYATYEKKKMASYDTYRKALLRRHDKAVPTYTDDPKAFHKDYHELAKKPLEYSYQNVLGGAGKGPRGRKFGVELEFVISDKSKSVRSVLRDIAEDFQKHGLSKRSTVGEYHDSQDSGWDSWAVEEDGSVDGEIVSPIMSDTPESWEKLETVCKILKSHGCSVDSTTGSHVHISTGSYGFSTAKHTELRRNVLKNEDLLYRLGSNPSAGRHRGISYCVPNTIDKDDDISSDINYGVYNVPLSNNQGMLNMGYSADIDNVDASHVEFRMWDGTLDAAVVQKQVQVSAAMVDRAERDVLVNGLSSRKENHIRQGVHRHHEDREKGRRSAERFHEMNKDVAQFLDETFPDKESRQSVMHLFAKTKWNKKMSALEY